MALDMTGIINENEFYTQHYLQEILDEDLKDIFKTWKAEAEKDGSKTPDQELRSLPQPYFKLKAKLAKIALPARVLELQQAATHDLLYRLGYELSSDIKITASNAALPILGEIKDNQGNPQLWILETISPISDPEDPLEQVLLPEQYPDDESLQPLEESFVELISKEIFGLTTSPRWIILLDFSSVVLIDRSKWNEKRLLRFDLNEIYGRGEASTFRAMAALLHRTSLCPDDGQALLDTLDEQSHRHAFAVSEDLKYSLREAIELIGNEVIFYKQAKSREGVYNKDVSDELTIESLRYMYRLLFLFYLEARPELGFAEMKNVVYRQGYSLESLRDLEIIPLTTEESRNGYFLHKSISMIFDLVYNGFYPTEQSQIDLDRGISHDNFSLPALKSHLFDPERTPILNKVKFRNFVLQRILELMSLSRPKSGKKHRRGRISYAQLGINQLGAVYEGLLSYRGFFAETDLYEVKMAKQDSVNELDQAFFVTEDDLPKYAEDEKVFNSKRDQERNPLRREGSLRKYPKGTFIYRLAGRDRQKSASYYTPEVLTQCLVKYGLKELLQNKSADDILKLKICEPAMGSAAFLNEAINQLADAYMQKKQKDRNEVLNPEAYNFERQKVKMLLADQNVFGVDLNPIAVELAEVSLWLNSIHAGGFVPWFGMQLHTGNSLIGARRQMYESSLLGKKVKGQNSWLDEVPKRYWPKTKGANPPKSEISDRAGKVYHFLLPDPGMANYKDRVVKNLAPIQIDTINKWRKTFTQSFKPNEIKLLEQLSDTIDRLWTRHTQQLRNLRASTTDPLQVYGQESTKGEPSTTRLKDKRFTQEVMSEDIQNSSLYRRLKMAMDYWCALWFWPIERADLLPTRSEYLSDMQLIIEGQEVELLPDVNEQIPLFPSTAPKQEMLALKDEFGFVDVETLSIEVERLALVKTLVQRYQYLHWELEYADIYADNGGFDFVLGNPPWIKIEWKEKQLLSEYDPIISVRKNSSTEVASLRESIIKKNDIIDDYCHAYESSAATQNYLNATSNFNLLKNTQTNLFKAFLASAQIISKDYGVFSIVSDEGIYNDPNGGSLREYVYQRLRYLFMFQNEKPLFQEVGHQKNFDIHILRMQPSEIKFDFIANLFHPSTIENSYIPTQSQKIPGIKDEFGKWDYKGHPSRILKVDANILSKFALLNDKPGTIASKARLSRPHTEGLLNVLIKIGKHNYKLDRYLLDILISKLKDESNAQKAGLIRRETGFPNSLNETIYSGPNIHLGNPLYQTPRRICNTKGSYDSLDMELIPSNYLPRTNYVSAVSEIAYLDSLPRFTSKKGKYISDYYRIGLREMLSDSWERTTLVTIFPKALTHISTLVSICFASYDLAQRFGALASSLPFDFLVRSSGAGHANKSFITTLPIYTNSVYSKMASLRFLLLNCVTDHYSELWSECWSTDFQNDKWLQNDLRLPKNRFLDLNEKWIRKTGSRNAFERRQLLIELDILAAKELKLSLDELCSIYRTHFPVLFQNENDTWYDQNGRIVFTCSKGLSGVGFSRTEWNEVKNIKSGTVDRIIEDDTVADYRYANTCIVLDDGNTINCPCPDYPAPIRGPVKRIVTYAAPFTKSNREQDYRTAWVEFDKRGLVIA